MKNRFPALITALLLCSAAYAIKVETFTYALRDSALQADVYFPNDTLTTHQCVIYAFGGGFKQGARNQPEIVAVARQIAERGVVCICIDYRLGLKGKELKKPMEALPYLEASIEMATEDMLTAAAFVYNNAARLRVDKNLIIASGTSAGAIAALQADYYLHSNNPMAANMPEGFKFAGVLSFAGAVATFKGKVDYTSQPAPTLFVHGTKDRLVPYDHFSVAGKGLYGSSYLAEYFQRNDWPYEIIRYENFGHEVSWLGFKENVPEIRMFIERFVLKQGSEAKYGVSIDVTHIEKNVTEPIWNVNGLKLYKKDAKGTLTTDSLQLKRLYDK